MRVCESKWCINKVMWILPLFLFECKSWGKLKVVYMFLMWCEKYSSSTTYQMY